MGKKITSLLLNANSNVALPLNGNVSNKSVKLVISMTFSLKEIRNIFLSYYNSSRNSTVLFTPITALKLQFLDLLFDLVI